jgi:ABC-type glycerol-3-phosphate transport system permease component
MKERRTMKFLWKHYARRILLPVGGLAITAVMLLPIYFTVESSLEPTSVIQSLSQSLVPSHFVLSNYSFAFDAESGSILTSLLIGFRLGLACPPPTASQSSATSRAVPSCRGRSWCSW